MDSSSASPRSAVPDELCFVLRVRPERDQSPWHAELISPDGRTSAFWTPIELIRYLAGMEMAASRRTGLR
jgi:hypothetical protein